MRILFYCDEYPPFKCGGIGSVTKIIAEELVRKGHFVIVFGTYESPARLPYISFINGVKVYRLRHFNFLNVTPSFFRRYLMYFLKKIKLLSIISNKIFINNQLILGQILKKEKIEIVELIDYMELLKYSNQKFDFYKFDVFTVMKIHGSLTFLNECNQSKNLYHRINDSLNYDRSDHLIAVSEYSKNFVIDIFNYDSRRFTVIHNPIDNSLLENINTFNKNQNNILFFGKIIESKGAFQVIKAFNIIGNIYSDVSLTLVGSGEIDFAKLLVDKSLENRVFFTGYVNRNTVIDYIDNCMFCVIPSFFETFSMAALEVMARKKALIFTKYSSGTELINDGIDGILVDPHDLNEIIYKMSILIDNVDLRNKLALNAHNKVFDSFSADVISDKIISFYSSVITRA